MSRRTALGLIGLGSAGIAVGVTGLVAGWGSQRDLAPPAETGLPLRQPNVVPSVDGVLDATLTAAPGVTVAGRTTTAWGYNGTSPGPTLRAHPGDVLRVRLANGLSGPTNLHTHGLHVSPQGNSDNPFVAIEPGASFEYSIRIPSDHPGGTFWYHPHHHGTAADQVYGGLFGALVVDGAPAVDVDQDRILVISDITLDQSGGLVLPTPAERFAGREGDQLLVNGQHQPIITARTGSRERWRIINACTSRVLALRARGLKWDQVALDGLSLAEPAERDLVLLAPGNRADMIVRPTEAGESTVVAEFYDRGSAMMGGGMGRRAVGPITVATVHVQGDAAAPAALPARLAAPVVPLGAVTRRRHLTLASPMGMGMGMGGAGFTFDDRPFDPTRDDQIVTLGSTEEWTLTNRGHMDHPFHLHAWPVRVLDTVDPRWPVGTLQDVVMVPAGGQIRLGITFADFAGRSVYHCHILDHEDLGMMGTINVKAA
jgi:FtsP/CotA-like multicopper oxidase with cupredoxin domain